MNLPNKLLEQIAFNTRPKIEKHMLIVMNKSIHEEHLSHPLQTKNKQFKIAVTVLTDYDGIFNITNKNNQFYFTTSLSDLEPNFIFISTGAFELEHLHAEIERNFFNHGQFTESNYPFKIKPNFSTLGSIREIDVGIGRKIDFTPNDSIRDLLGFKPNVIHEECHLSDYPVDLLSFDNYFLECDIAQGMIFKGEKSTIIHNFTMDVDPGYKYIEKFRGGVKWYMMESKDIISSISFKLKNEDGDLVSFNGQSITFRLSIEEI